MRPQLPIWSIPLLFVLLGLIFFVGDLPKTAAIIVAVETVLYSAYLIFRKRSSRSPRSDTTW